MNLQKPPNFSQHWLQLLPSNLPSSNLPSSNSKIPECDLETLSKETQGFTQINGSTPPGTLAPTQNQKVLLDIVNAQGQRVLMVKAIRKAGTRVGIHIHRYGGYTLILKGVMTDFVEGQPNKKYGPNSGYYMPPCTPMSAANLGSQDVELIDIFIGPPGQPYIEILEPDWKFKRINRWK
jgi:quercetin dioxygenase-like cupin family protein